MKNKYHIRQVFSLLMGISVSVFYVVFFTPLADAMTLYWVGANGASTNTASNWKTTDPASCGGGDALSPPNSGDDIVFDADCDNGANVDTALSVGSITLNSGYSGTVTQSASITTAAALGSYSQAGGTFSGGSAAIDIGNDFSITGGAFTSTTGTLSLEGDYSRTSGTFAHNNGTVTFDGGFAQTMTGETFFNLTINNSVASPTDTDDVDPSAAVTVQNNLTVSDGQFSPPTSTDIDGDVSITTNGILKPDSSSTITVGGSWANSGTFTSNSGTINFNAASGTETINAGGTGNAAKDFDNLTKSGGGTLQLTSTALEVDGTMTISASNIVDLNGQNLTLATLDNPGTLQLEGGETVAITTFDSAEGTVLYDGTGTYASGLVTGDTYFNLTFNGAGTWTLDAALTLETLTLAAGTLDVHSTSNFGISVGEDWSNTGGAFAERQGTVTFNDNGAQSLTGETFYNLTINNSAALPGDAADVDSSAAVTVTNTLTVTDGQFQPTTASDFAAVTITTNGILKPDSGATITVSGNWNNTGTLTANTGTVSLDGSSQTLNDDNTFYNLTKTVSSADTLTFEASTNQTISNTLTLDGTNTATLSLLSSSNGVKFTLSPASATTVTYLNVKDSQASTSNITCSTGCANSGGNDDGEAAPHWVFGSGGGGGNTAPTASTPNSITQIGDLVEFKTNMADSDGNRTQLLVEYSSDQSSWKKANISSVSASQGDVSITNSADFPIQSIDTDGGTVTLTIRWNAAANFVSEESTMYLRLTPHDSTVAGSMVVSESFAVDTRAPIISTLYLAAHTANSLTMRWTPESEANFDTYVLCYGTNLAKVQTCNTTGSGAAKLWTATQAPNLNTFTTAQTTITGLINNTNYHVLLKATDDFAHTSTLLATNVRTGTTPVAPTLSVGTILGNTIEFKWLQLATSPFGSYELCYGTNATKVIGLSCQTTNPNPAVKLNFTNPATIKTVVTGLLNNTLYFAKMWYRINVSSAVAGNFVTATTCSGNQVRINGICTAPPAPAACADGLDNDGDGLVDFPSDAGCSDASDDNESTPAPPPTPIPPPAPTPTPELPVPTPTLPPEEPPADGGIIGGIIGSVVEFVENVVESVVEFIEDLFGEGAARVVRTVVAVAKQVIETTVRVVQAVAEVVPTTPAVVVPLAAATALTVAASTGLVSVVPNFTGELVYLWQRLMQGLVGIAGARRRFPWGRVVDAATGAPLPQTIVRILDRQTHKLRDTAITDAKGDFTSLLPAGQYRFEVTKPGWHLDPAPAGFLNILQNQQVYDGNFAEVRREGVVAIIIAMRPLTQVDAHHITLRIVFQRLERFLRALSWPLLVFGSTLSVLALVKEQTTLNVGIFILYIVLIGAKTYVQRNRQETLGQVKDAATQTPLKEALVQLYNAETGRLMATKVTSVGGQFALVPPPGVYTVVVSKAGYQTYKESHVVIRPEKQAALSMTFNLTPVAPQTMSVEGLAA